MARRADGSGTDRRFSLDDEKAEAKARMFAPGILDLGGTGEKVGFTRGEE